MRRILSSAALLVAPLAVAGSALDRQAAKLPPNQWVQVQEGGIGQRRGTSLVYVPTLKRFLAFGGVQDKKKPQPYSEMTLSLRERQWTNWLPEGKGGWGGRTGPVEAPGFERHRRGFHKDVEGTFRAVTKPDYGLYLLGLQHAWDSDRDRLIVAAYGTVAYDPAERTWQDLEPEGHPGRPALPGLDLEPRWPTWGQACYDPVNKEVLLFGGANVLTPSGAPGTWVYSVESNQWRKLEPGSATMRRLHADCVELVKAAHSTVAACRNRYYRTELADVAGRPLEDVVAAVLSSRPIERLLAHVGEADVTGHERQQLAWAAEELNAAVESCRELLDALADGANAQTIESAEGVKEALRRASISLSPEPPPRCYSPMAYDPASKKILLFGGYALDRTLADTWLYDPATRTWEQRRPKRSPPPRLSHGTLYLPASGRLVVVGGQRSDFPGRASSFSAIVPDAWAYDVTGNRWRRIARWPELRNKGPMPPMGSGCMLKDHQEFAVDQDDVVVTLGARSTTWACRLDPSAADETASAEHGVAPGTEELADNYLAPKWFDSKAPTPDADAVAKELANLPANKWVQRRAGGLEIPIFAYSTVTIDTDRDQILAWAGGHATYHGTAVHRYALATDRWHMDYRAQQPLTYGYFSTSGPHAYGCRPWMGVHPWGFYAYGPVLRRLVIPKSLTYLFDPDRGEWEVPHISSPPGGPMRSVAATTPHGVCLWTSPRRGSGSLWRLDAKSREWVQIETRGAALPKCRPDRSGITWDSKRKRLVLLDKDLEGDVVTCHLATGRTVRHEPANKDQRGGFLREFEYIPPADLVFYAGGNYWDPAANAWGKLDVDTSALGKGISGTSSGLVYDPKRELVWLVRGYQSRAVYVLKLHAEAPDK
ncbi:MAG: kelch repeat-containing protein [Candidatus Brocadiia bacterium]